MADPGKNQSSKAASMSINKRMEDQRHERMLLAINKQLPGLIRDQLQTSQFLNNAISKKRDTWTQKIKNLIVAKKMNGAQADIWKKVPHVSYGSPGLDLANIRFSVGLEQGGIDYHLRNRAASKIIYTADFVAEFSVVTYDIYLRDGSETSYREAPLTVPADGISLQTREHTFQLAGGIYPGTLTIGSVAADMAKLFEATQQSRHEICLPIFATDREEMFNVLSSQFDALLFDSSGSLVAHDLKQVKETIDPSLA